MLELIRYRLSVRCLVFTLLLVSFCDLTVFAQTNAAGPTDYSFMVAGDMRNFLVSPKPNTRYFDGACEAMKKFGPGAFLLSPGDCDPPGAIRGVIDRYLGTNYLWYPMVGNHDVEGTTNLIWYHQWADAGIPGLVRKGPTGSEETTFSFDYGNSHFIVLDEYFNGKVSSAKNSRDIAEATLAWLEEDLAANRQPIVWVSGHKPIESLPDMDTGLLRHKGESVTMQPEHSERFLKLLQQHHVRGYICGHTHNSSVTKLQSGIWQLDSGHSRGGVEGSPSTFLMVRVNGTKTTVDVYRANRSGTEYHVAHTIELD